MHVISVSNPNTVRVCYLLIQTCVGPNSPVQTWCIKWVPTQSQCVNSRYRTGTGHIFYTCQCIKSRHRLQCVNSRYKSHAWINLVLFPFAPSIGYTRDPKESTKYNTELSSSTQLHAKPGPPNFAPDSRHAHSANTPNSSDPHAHASVRRKVWDWASLLRREHQASPRSCYGSRANCPINFQVFVNGFSEPFYKYFLCHHH